MGLDNFRDILHDLEAHSLEPDPFQNERSFEQKIFCHNLSYFCAPQLLSLYFSVTFFCFLVGTLDVEEDAIVVVHSSCQLFNSKQRMEKGEFEGDL